MRNNTVERTINFRLRLKPDGTWDLEQCSEYNETVLIVEEGEDKIITIQAIAEELRYHG
jgi:hypothetical protein